MMGGTVACDQRRWLPRMGMLRLGVSAAGWMRRARAGAGAAGDSPHSPPITNAMIGAWNGRRDQLFAAQPSRPLDFDRARALTSM